MWANFKKLMGKNNKGAEVPQRVKSQDGVIKGGVEAEQIWTEAYRKLGVQDLDDKTYRKHEAEKIIKKNGSRARKSNKERGSKLDARSRGPKWGRQSSDSSGGKPQEQTGSPTSS